MQPSTGENKNAVEAWLSELNRPVKTIVFVDIVESVRLMEEHEHSVITRWLHLVSRIEREVLPVHAGRLVKSTGDGLMMEFSHPRAGVQAALQLQALAREEAAATTDTEPIALRAGIHVTPIVADTRDLYGKGVNLAARLMGLAGPGEIVVSEDVRHGLTADLDADIEDLGPCYLKHVPQPVHGYRLGAPRMGGHTVPERQSPPRAAVRLAPTLAVIPFSPRDTAGGYAPLGDILADETIAALSKSADWNVISSLSTHAFRNQAAPLSSIVEALDANYVLRGSYSVLHQKVLLSAELCDARAGHVIWADVLRGDLAAVVNGDAELVSQLATQVSQAINHESVQAVRFLALPNLASHALLFGAIGLMHRALKSDFDRAQQALQHLIDRHPRAPIPYAWSAKWNVLCVTRGWVSNTPEFANRTLDLTKRALDADPACSMALSIGGFVQCHLHRNLEAAETSLAQARALNPSDSLAWLFSSVVHAFRGDGQAAMPAAERALRLSPLDPLKYYYDSLAATAALAARDYERARALAERSLRANRSHPSTLRALATAHAMLGDLERARDQMDNLLALEPGFSIARFKARTPSADFEIGEEWAQALRLAGAPEN
jgi:adenylate cyclase